MNIMPEDIKIRNGMTEEHWPPCQKGATTYSWPLLR